MSTKVFVPAMEKRSAIAIVRSLGKKGIEIVGASENKNAAGFSSKYCHKKYTYHSPIKDINKYQKDIEEILSQEKPHIFFPINEDTLLPLLKKREYFEKLTTMPLPPNEALEYAFNKTKTHELAESLNIPVPKLIKDSLESVKYPIIARPKNSVRIQKNKLVSQKISYIFSEEQRNSHEKENFFFQEYISGRGYGFYALFEKGVPKAYFMLKRINEIPFFGGPSSLRESIFDEELKEYGLKILKELKWHGVAMVEFRQDERDKKFKLIEINPRFWGSLSLAIHSGVDFPYLLLNMVQNKLTDTVFNYQTGIKCRWLFGDIRYLKSVLFGKKIDKRPSRIKTMFNFFKFCEKNLHYDYFAKSDLGPALAEIRNKIF
jgi:predicted ATP-grasp superfamily ATP-dependent carboligase